MSEYKIHHLVGELLQLLGSNGSPEEFVKLLTVSSSTQTCGLPKATQSHVQELASSSPNAELFLQKYEELKLKNVDSLGPFVELCWQISKDPGIKKLLKKTTHKSRKSSKITSEVMAAQMTPDDLPQVKNRLLQAVAEKGQSAKYSNVLNQQSSSNLFNPSMCAWIQKRPSMSWDFSMDNLTTGLVILGPIPVQSQESVLIEDLLYTLEGIEGVCIEPQPLIDLYGLREFSLSRHIDPSLQDLVRQILPLASHFSIVQRFIEEKVQFEDGQVNHALAAAMFDLLKDYYLFICQLETEQRTGNLTLHKMWFYVQRNMQSMSIMASIASTIGKADARGGKVLSLLHEHAVTNMADAKARDLCLYLTQHAAVPYMEILSTWIYTGIINDPFKEFFVEDNEVVCRDEQPVNYSDDYWEKRYSVRRERLPTFLERVADSVLRAGKYLNVIRQCGKTIETKTEVLVYTIKEVKFVEAIEKAYLCASQMLQELLMVENDLIGRLRSVKHYFLLDQGDFIVQFMDLCEKELYNDVSDVVISRLEALLELALRLSVANKDPYKDDMRIQLLPYDLQFQMFKILSIDTQEENEYRMPIEKQLLSGLESFSFGYEVKWPVSLVLNRKAIACYQMIFRHLFHCKHVERLICRVWMYNKEAKSFPHNEARHYRAAFTLRQRMLTCVQNLEYHMMVEVIDPNWHTFLTKISKATNVDEILVCHCDFLDMCLKDCMLTNPALLRTVTKMLSICVDFCNFIQRMQRYYVDAELSSMISSAHEATEFLCQSPEPDSFASSEEPISSSVSGDTEAEFVSENESFEQSISKFDLQFTAVLLGLMDKINELSRTNSNDKLVNLLYRLDFNSYYSKQLEQFSSDYSSYSVDISG